MRGRLISRNRSVLGLASNSTMFANRFAVICLVLALSFQAALAAAMSPMFHGCCGGKIAVTNVIAATSCCDDQGPDRHVMTGASECTEASGCITKSYAGEPSSCPSCPGDCAGASSPGILPEAMPALTIPPSFEPLRLQGSLHLSQPSQRLERPPRATLS